MKNCQSVTIIPQKIRFFAGGIEFDGAQSIIKKQIMDDNNLNNGLDGLLDMFKKLIEGHPMAKYLPIKDLQIVKARYGNEANQIGAFLTYLEQKEA